MKTDLITYLNYLDNKLFQSDRKNFSKKLWKAYKYLYVIRGKCFILMLFINVTLTIIPINRQGQQGYILSGTGWIRREEFLIFRSEFSYTGFFKIYMPYFFCS